MVRYSFNVQLLHLQPPADFERRPIKHVLIRNLWRVTTPHLLQGAYKGRFYMSTAELVNHSDGKAIAGTHAEIGPGPGWSPLDLLKAGAQGSEQKGKELLGAGLMYLMSCELTLVKADTPQIPKEAQDLLDKMGYKDLSVKGDKVTLSLKSETYQNFPGAPQLWFDKEVTANIKTSQDKIEITNINGMMVNPGDYIPWANVQSASFEKKDGKCFATVTGGRFGVDRTQKIELPQEVFDQIQKIAKANGL